MPEANPYPAVYVLGAPKCGTTSLHEYLGQHPDIFVSEKKELHFFSSALLDAAANGPGDAYALRTLVRGEAEYLHWFSDAAASQITVDVSPSYLYHHQAATRVRAARPDARLIAVVRDPVEKSYSQYLHMVRAQRETLSFEAALEAEPTRIADAWSDMWRYTESSFYSRQLRAWAEVFGTEALLVLFSEDLSRRPDDTMRRVFDFLAVPPRPVARSTRRNAGGLARSKRIARFVEGPNRAKLVVRKIVPESIRGRIALRLLEANTGKKPELAAGTRRALENRFAPEAEELSRFVGVAPPWPWIGDHG